MINIEVTKKLEELGINIDDALTYLLSLYHNLKASYIPELVKKQVNMTGIVVRDYNKGIVTWTMPLYTDKALPEHLQDKWDWVISEYRVLFMNIRPDAGGDRKSCIKKMQQFFADNPEVRKEDVIEATKLYLEGFVNGNQEVKYMRRANYFISKVDKGDGQASTLSDLSMYVEIVQNRKKQSQKIIDKRRVL